MNAPPVPTTSPLQFTLLSALWHDDRIAQIWSASSCISTWLRVEGALAEAQARAGVISDQNAALIAARCGNITIDQERFWQETRVVGYPILPLITQLTEQLPADAAGQLHYGATTQDIMDTALALQLTETAGHLSQLLIEFGDGLATLTERHASTVMAGRTHAQQAVPTTFGAKLAVFLEQIRDELENLRRAEHAVATVSLFGAGGTSAAAGSSSARVRADLADSLGLSDATVPWHVARGSIVRFGQSLGTISAVCVRFAREIIDLSRTEIAEVHEKGAHHRGASSTMPQKANPISCEAIVGFGVSASSVAAGLNRAMESGHERAAGEWQVEWFAMPTLAQLTASAVGLSIDTVRGLDVFTAAMEANLSLDHGLVMSEAAMMLLAPSLGRDRAHDLVYAAALRSRRDDIPLLESVRAAVPDDVRDVLVDFAAGSYLGEIQSICDVAIARWRATVTDRANATHSNYTERESR